jgi:hypothetical protein
MLIFTTQIQVSNENSSPLLHSSIANVGHSADVSSAQAWIDGISSDLAPDFEVRGATTILLLSSITAPLPVPSKGTY